MTEDKHDEDTDTRLAKTAVNRESGSTAASNQPVQPTAPEKTQRLMVRGEAGALLTAMVAAGSMVVNVPMITSAPTWKPERWRGNRHNAPPRVQGKREMLRRMKQVERAMMKASAKRTVVSE